MATTDIPHIGLTRQQYWTRMYNSAREVLLTTFPKTNPRNLDKACTRYANIKTERLYGQVKL